ncbi:MAG: hypothetical protein KU38_13265 [Sulfurovum sp. FS08-3]|nr:MAG: hypothetical protein KU38_13265 [Sulfurovum sp. FS08-3]
MQVRRGSLSSSTAGDRKIIYCELVQSGVDELFYKTLLGTRANEFEFKGLGSSQTLLNYAKTGLVQKGFCLIDRDFRQASNVDRLEQNNQAIKFLKVHELEYFLLNATYLSKLSNLRESVDINQEINKVLEENRIKFMADFLQFRMNEFLEQFPRITKLNNSEVPDNENDMIAYLLEKLDSNYNTVKEKVEKIKNEHIKVWKNEYDQLTLKELPSKEILKQLKHRIFNNPLKDSDLAKEIAAFMSDDGFLPPELEGYFN